ncbi:MAG: UvrD-helicase domain-containing protein [Desulfovibrio sp.]|nr:UvrD-helicase domain-containing protein [Desulfovibrio sp.]
MTFLADLHIHSRFSLATSKDLSARNLDAWARAKGLNVIATGDCVHPAWRKEMREQLVRDEDSGLYKLAVAREKLPFLPEKTCLETKQDPLFLLETEISSIYKKKGRVRKVHTLVYLPSLEDADLLAKRLEKLGNIASDGRPILGLDPKILLELTLEIVPNAVLVPAHIWTPWFALFGSRSGFDRIEECFEDLTQEIFALETGLSSDPLMNRYISALDGYALISNSDAHSGSKLAREANIFAGKPSFAGIFSALKASARRDPKQDELSCRFLGTMEFFPEEGKYHLDGHRACHVSLNPLETRELQNICPVCHKPLTIGVLHRVMELADRTSPASPPLEPRFQSIMPLQEMIAEILNVGPTSRKVQTEYGRMLASLGSELDILLQVPLTDLSSYSQDLAIACGRLRQGQVQLKAGYDGEFGRVRIFTDEEQAQRGRKKSIYAVPGTQSLLTEALPKQTATSRQTDSSRSPSQENLSELLRFQALQNKSKTPQTAKCVYSQAQQAAIQTSLAPTLVLAGPGSGKTHLLMGRIGYLLEQGHKAEKILAITFTRRAAEEMRKRLMTQLGHDNLPVCTTLHAFCYQILRQAKPDLLLQSEDSALRLFLHANPTLDKTEGRKIWEIINRLREECRLDASDYARLFANYLAAQKSLSDHQICDFTQLVESALAFFQAQPSQFSAVLVDEIQDCSPLNLALIKTLLPPNGSGFFGIGDPDQAIYGFRGSVENIELALRRLWPNLYVRKLDQSFRSAQEILNTAQSLLQTPHCGKLMAAKNLSCQLHFCQVADEQAESRWIARTISQLLGKSSHSLEDSQKTEDEVLAPSDIAVLVRFKQLMPPIAKSLTAAGIPVFCPAVDAFWHDSCIEQLLELLDPTQQSPSFPFDKNALPKPEAMLPWLETQSWSGYQPGKSTAFRKLCQMWRECGDWEKFFQELLWLKNEENYREKSEAVRLLTLHAAKGLEFQAVFLPAMEEGILPADLSSFAACRQNEEERERQKKEEARLCYVGITRASRLLYVSRAESRMLYGKRRAMTVSSFFEGIQEYFKKSRVTEKTRKIQVVGSLLN